MVIFFATFISDIQTLPCLIGYYTNYRYVALDNSNSSKNGNDCRDLFFLNISEWCSLIPKYGVQLFL